MRANVYYSLTDNVRTVTCLYIEMTSHKRSFYMSWKDTILTYVYAGDNGLLWRYGVQLKQCRGVAGRAGDPLLLLYRVFIGSLFYWLAVFLFCFFKSWLRLRKDKWSEIGKRGAQAKRVNLLRNFQEPSDKANRDIRSWRIKSFMSSKRESFF